MNKILRLTLFAVVSLVAGMASAQTVFDFDNDYATIFPTLTGVSSSSSTAGDITAPTTSIAKNGVTLTVSASTTSTANRIWSASPRLRIYGGTLTINATNANITAISFVAGKWDTGNTFDSGTVTAATSTSASWSGSASTVVLTIKTNTQLKSMTITTEAAGGNTVSAPAINGDELFIGTTSVSLSAQDGASIFYTLDSSTPTSASTAYTGAFDLTSTKTVTAIAIKDGKSSVAASKTFTAALQTSDIDDFKAQANNTVAVLPLNNAKVVYADATNRNVYVQDETGAVCFYNAGLNLTTGDVLKGYVAGKLSIYSNLPEFVSNSLTSTSTFTKEAGDPVAPISVSVADVQNNKYICQLVQLSGVKLDSVDTKLYAYQGDASIQVYDQFKTLTGLTVVKGSENNTVTGILVPYNDIYEIYPITVEGITTTAISAPVVNADDVDAPAYNLAGQRVEAAYKGVVIRNGKKFIQR